MIYRNIKQNRLLLIVPVAALLMVGLGTQRALAWGGWWNGGGPFTNWGGGGGYWNQGGDNPYQNGWTHGIADAQYDHQNSLVYNNDGVCCHSPTYWEGFHHGYDQQWNTYQNSEQNSQQTVNNYINVQGNGNEIYLNDRQNTDQNSEQGQTSDQEPSYQDP